MMLSRRIVQTNWVAVFIAAALIVLAGAPGARAALTCKVNPDTVGIGTWYHGQKLVISGTSDAADDLIVKIASPMEAAHLKFKGKAGGLFWMKIGDMEFEPVPTVYKLYATKEVQGLLADADRDAQRIGYDALERGMEIKSSKGEVDKDFWFQQLVQFKEKDHLFGIREGEITRNGGDYQLDVDWPYQAAPGEYTVEVLAVRDGHVVDKAQTTLTVARAGLVEQLSWLAFNRAAVYGIIAIVIALVAGFAVGALFKGGGGGH